MRADEFFTIRRPGTNQIFTAQNGNGKTVAVSSHIYWVDLIGLGLLRLGYNVLFTIPWYGFWTDDAWHANFDSEFARWVNTLRQHKVTCILGGNTTAMVPNKTGTGEPIHRAAGVPLINFWWDEPRAIPPMHRRGVSLVDYVRLLKDDRTLNVMWDADVMEELDQYLGIRNTMHVPLGTIPDFWDAPFVPMQERAQSVCFLGNFHHVPEAEKSAFEPDLAAWAQGVAAKKMGNLDRSIVDCVEGDLTVDANNEAALARDVRRWHLLDFYLREEQRVRSVQSLARRLGEGFTLIGSHWEKAGLKAQRAHSGVPGAKTYYASHKASLNLFGGCVHGGMPLRPYDIASANGLIFTHYNRELPGLFEPGKECVAFRSESEMLAQLDRILSHPAEFNRIIGAGHRRVIQEHSWEHRMKTVMAEVGQRFGIAV